MDQMKASNATFLDESTGGKGKYFRARILQAGLVKYSFGVCLLDKEVIDKFVYEFVGCPVIIDHKDVTEENAKEERVGVISRVWFDQMDGWFWVEGVIFDEKAISLINDGYNVSCQYEISEYANNVTDALHNGNSYDKVILNGKPEHLAIVKNPRYENAMIAVNALDATNKEDDIEWITVKGNHIPVKKGQSKEEAVREFLDSKQAKKEETNTTKDTRKHLNRIEKLIKKYNLDPDEEEELLDELGSFEAKLDEGLNAKEEEELREALFDFEDDIKRHQEMRKQDIKKSDTKEEKSEINNKLYSNLYKEFIKNTNINSEDWKKIKTMFKDYIKENPKDEFNGTINKLIDEMNNIENKMNAKNSIIQAINEIKETDMFKKLFKKKENNMDKDELKSLFMECLSELTASNSKEEEKEEKIEEKIEEKEEKVEDKAENSEDEEKEDEKEDVENKAKNEVVDKRDIIRQIMAIAGKHEDNEDVREIAKLAEKLAYEKSEADKKADNKCKNEEKEEEKEDKKASNSILEGQMAAGKVEFVPVEYNSRKSAIELGNELF